MFKNLKSLEVTGDEVIDFEFGMLDGSPVLRCRPANESNTRYYNALLKRSTKLAKRLRGRDMDAKSMRQSRAFDAELFPLFVIEGWETNQGPLDDNGKRVPYSGEAAAGFIEALSDYAPDIFDEMRNTLSQSSNFRPDEPTVEDAEELGES